MDMCAPAEVSAVPVIKSGWPPRERGVGEHRRRLTGEAGVEPMGRKGPLKDPPSSLNGSGCEPRVLNAHHQGVRIHAYDHCSRLSICASREDDIATFQ